MMYTDEELLDGICSLAEDLGSTPTIREMRNQGEYSASVYIKRFGSWNAAVEAAGLQVNKNTDFSKDDLIDELRRLHDELGHPPRNEDIKEHSQYSRRAYENEFESWNEALEQAGLDTRHSTVEIPIEDLIEDVRRVADEIDRPPRQTDIVEHGQYSTQAYYTKFESWTEVLEAADLPKPKPQYDVSTEDLLDELRRVYDKLGRPPTQEDITNHAEHGSSTYYNRFGSIKTARKAAGLPAEIDRSRGPTKRLSDEDLIVKIQSSTLGNQTRKFPKKEPVDAIERLAGDIDRPTGAREMDEMGDYWAKTYISRLGYWHEALARSRIRRRPWEHASSRRRPPG